MAKADGKTRLNVVLSKQNSERLSRIVTMMEADSVADVVKDSLRLLEYFLKISENDGKILVQLHGEKPKRIEIFGISTK